MTPPDLPPVILSPEQKEKLIKYSDLLTKWQAKINLVSPRTLDSAWDRHFIDSAQLASLIPSEAKTLFDLGSGAGFPGMVLAILRPDLSVHLVESDAKKCAFIQTVSRETKTPVHIHNNRIESVSIGVEPDIITSRALAPLIDLINFCEPWIASNPNLSLIFHKGKTHAEEGLNASKNYTFSAKTYGSQTDPDGVLMLVSDIRKAP